MNNKKDAAPSADKHNCYWDPRFKRQTIKLLPGDYYVSQGEEMIVTVLGSCVSACIRDKVKGIGGMNHFMLPEDSRTKPTDKSLVKDFDNVSARYGACAMEMLINDILKGGGRRENLEAKVFGGGKVSSDMSSDIGANNILFVKEYLGLEKIDIVSQDVGNVWPRKVYYIPDTGDVYVRKIERMNNLTIIEREKSYSKELKQTDATGDVFFLD